MRAMSKRDTIYSVGNQIGVGKESGTSTSAESWFVRVLIDIVTDIYIVADKDSNELVLKLHRWEKIPPSQVLD